MKGLTVSAALLTLSLWGAAPALAQQDQSAPPLVKQINNGNWLPQQEAESLRDELYYQRAVHAYMTMLPALNVIGMRDGSEAAFGKGYNVLPIWKDRMDSRTWVPTPNADVIYSMSYLDLKETGPLVVAAPRDVIGMFTDFFQRTITDVGLIGPDRARGGLYLLLPPDYDGEIPQGYFAFKSRTYNVFLFFRTIMAKGDSGPDPKPAVALAELTRVYPLWTPEKDVKPMQFPNGSGKPINMMYPVDDTFWSKLKAFVDYEPVSAIDPELRGVLASIGIIKGQPFNPDAKQHEALRKAVETAPKMILALRQLGRPDGRQLYYKDRQYENGAQVPDFGDRFWVYAMYDARTDQFGQLGKPYNSKPGFYLLAGPRWRGLKPAGVTDVIRCSTSLANTIPRVFQDDTPEDKKAIQPVINQIVFYPLKDFTGKMKTIEWSKAPNIPVPQSSDGGETKWVIPEKFFDEFGEALDIVDSLPGEGAMYGQFRLLLDAASKDPELKKALVETAVETEHNVIQPFFQWKHNGRPAGNGWNRSTHNAEWGIDYFNRTGTAKSNMFDNRPNETQYFYTDYDGAGAELNGGGDYEITFAAGGEPPVNGFWSLTLYNDKHLFHPNSLNRYSLGTKNKNLKRNADGSLTLYAGAKSPGAEKDSNWLPAPDGHFSLYIRAYWGKEGILDGSWKPPVIRNVA